MTREERLFYAIGGVEDRLLEDCEELFSRPVTVRRKKWPLLPAACLCAALAAGLLLRFYQPFLLENDLEGIAQDEAAGSACSSSSTGRLILRLGGTSTARYCWVPTRSQPFSTAP